MAAPGLNHSWPAFPKLWLKRWAFKRGSESKPCVQSFDTGAADLTTSSSCGSWRPGHLDFFSTMGDEQEDAVPGPLGDSTEDLSLDWGALQGSQYLQDLGLEAPAHGQTGAAGARDPPSGAAGSGSASSGSAGPRGRPRRGSWARPRSCSDSWQRCSLDASAVSEGPCLPRTLATLALNLPGESPQAWTKERLSGGGTPAEHPGKEGAGLEERVRSQSVPVTLDEISAVESSRASEVPARAAQGLEPPGPERLEEDRVEPDHL
nr:rho guanine nucleotide exchange factor 18-like isoform X2 [Pipistrellus kuhlii]